MAKLKAFKDVLIGEKFHCNGNLCLKKSTKTALLTNFDRVFYFGQEELVRSKIIT